MAAPSRAPRPATPHTGASRADASRADAPYPGTPSPDTPRTDTRHAADRTAGPAKLRPTIAVLPFYAVGDDGQTTFFGEMLAEAVSRVVTRTQYANIISHFSCRAIDVRRIVLGSGSAKAAD